MGALNDRGAALIDVIFTAGLIALVSSIAIPVLQASRQYDQARSASRFLAARLQHARTEALRRNATVAVRFDPDDSNRFGVYVDGDGDGVLETDITRGVDRQIAAEARFSDYAEGMAFRINQDVLEPETGAALAAGADPLRLGRSTLVSFSPLGSATSGTLYLAAATGPQMAVRILGATSRMRVLRYDRSTRQWLEE
jgi:Tfp pilus assembly protein FimT